MKCRTAEPAWSGCPEALREFPCSIVGGTAQEWPETFPPEQTAKRVSPNEARCSRTQRLDVKVSRKPSHRENWPRRKARTKYYDTARVRCLTRRH